MRPYFEKMTDLGKPLSDAQKKRMEESVKQIREVEKGLAEAVAKVKNAGLPAETLKKRGEWTVYQRLEYSLTQERGVRSIPCMIQWKKNRAQPALLMD